jgi:pimeloyl-ACP methyl ester carboxylesterase
VISSTSLQLSAPPAADEYFFEFIMKSGRALLVPVLKGHYSRRYMSPPAGPNAARDRLILESKDFRRSIDYLSSRADVDRDRLGVLGLSRCYVTPVLAVGERRLKAAALLGCGLTFSRSQAPEADPFNFLPRIRMPTLMVGGRNDFVFPVETSMRPMFRLLGTPEKDKRLALLEGGHAPPNPQLIVKETLDWFDRYLGPVK